MTCYVRIMKISTILEGGRQFHVPLPSGQKYVPRKSDEVFFNPHQEINRDFSILTLRAFTKLYRKKSFSACEPFGGAGIRTCRYIRETPISQIYYNDVNSTAFQIAEMNVEQLTEENQARVQMQNKEFSEFLNFLSQEDLVFDFIDIDPYGTPIPYAYNIIKYINKLGLYWFWIDINQITCTISSCMLFI